MEFGININAMLVVYFQFNGSNFQLVGKDWLRMPGKWQLNSRDTDT